METNQYYEIKKIVLQDLNLPEPTKEEILFKKWWEYVNTYVVNKRIEYVVNPPQAQQQGMLFFVQPDSRFEQIQYLIGKLKQRFIKLNPDVSSKRYVERMDDFVSREIWKFIRPSDSSLRGFKKRCSITKN